MRQLVPPEGNSAETGVYIAVRGSSDFVDSFRSWCVSTECYALCMISSGPYWFTGVYTVKDAVLAHAWLEEHGVTPTEKEE